MFARVSLFLAVAAVCSRVGWSQTTYYVSTNGTGSNSGLTFAAPWDLATGLAALTNNNTIVLLDGNFWTGPQSTPSGVGPATLMAQHKWTAGIVNGSSWNLGFSSPAAASALLINGLILTNAQGTDNLNADILAVILSVKWSEVA